MGHRQRFLLFSIHPGSQPTWFPNSDSMMIPRDLPGRNEVRNVRLPCSEPDGSEEISAPSSRRIGTLGVWPGEPDQKGRDQRFAPPLAQATPSPTQPWASVYQSTQPLADPSDRSRNLINGRGAQGETTRWISRHGILLATEPARGPWPQAVS